MNCQNKNQKFQAYFGYIYQNSAYQVKEIIMRTTLIIIFLSFFCFEKPEAQVASYRLIKVNYKSLVSKADLSFNLPVIRSEEGMPIGNGRMGRQKPVTISKRHS